MVAAALHPRRDAWLGVGSVETAAVCGTLPCSALPCCSKSGNRDESRVGADGAEVP
ncbi:hypothetical protein E2C01_083914 [Portunus trituberculatus]|uniref:Uncharacterized protein n=1 Tax=Portunus trituberculatus TaxID=210409 RepID=A0A5B7J4W8_PORTR|nr:hypothetical protein [Portunus trituberculatus]